MNMQKKLFTKSSPLTWQASLFNLSESDLFAVPQLCEFEIISQTKFSIFDLPEQMAEEEALAKVN